MSTADKLTHTRGLAWHNRRVLAERLGWPAGALKECERLDDEHPGWRFGYRDGLFTAAHLERQVCYRWAQAPDVAELVAKTAELDQLAAAQRAEWSRWTPRGWSVLRSQ
jgi:hypothetical protein